MAYMQGSAGAQNSQLGGPGRVPILPCLLARCFLCIVRFNSSEPLTINTVLHGIKRLLPKITKLCFYDFTNCPYKLLIGSHCISIIKLHVKKTGAM